MPKKARATIDLGFLRGDDKGTDLSGMFAASVANESEMQKATMLRVDRLADNPYQPRAQAGAEGLEELAGVIKSQGFQGVLIARPHPSENGSYQLTAGHRRRDAARRAGLHTLPVVVRDLTDEEMVTLAITENIQREDLNPLEEGKIYLMMAEEMGFTHEQIAREVGKKRGYVENRIRVARAPEDVQALVMAKPDSLRAVANLIKVKDARERAEIIANILSGELTVEDLPGYIEAKSAPQHSVQSRVAGDVFIAPPAQEASSVGAVAAQAHNGSGARGSRGEVAPPDFDSNPGDIEDPGRRAARIGSAKLAAVARYLNTYREQADKRGSVSAQERAALSGIKGLIDELHKTYAS